MAASDILLTTDLIPQKNTGIEKLVRDIEKRGINLRVNGNLSLGRITGQVGEFDKALASANARVIAFGASVGIINGITSAMRAMIREAVGVEKSLADINVLLDLSNESLSGFQSKLFAIGRKTGQGFSEVAEAAKEFSRQGLNAEETAKRTRDALLLVRLAGIDAKKAVDTLTSSVNGFAKEGLTTTEIVNRLATVDAKFAVSTKDLSDALTRVGESAQEAGVSFNELIALVAAVQQRTARGGAVIGNAFKTIFTRISRSDTLDQLEELGIAVRDTAGNTLPAIRILSQLASTYDTLNDAQKSFIGETVGGVYQINLLKAGLATLTTANGTYADALDTANNATDEAIKRNEKLNKTLAATANAAKLNLQELAAGAGKLVFGPSLEKILGGFNEFVDGARTESIGQKIGTGILSGIGSALSGPGLVIGVTLISKLFFQFLNYAKDASGTIANLGKQSEVVQNVQRQINSLLSSDSQARSIILNTTTSQIEKERQLVTYLQQELAIKQQIARLTEVTALGLVGRGVTASRFSEGFKFRTKNTAAGHIPTSSLPREAVFNEIAGAKSAGYSIGPQNVRAMKAKIDGKPTTVVYNNKETVIHDFMGTGEPAIIPPTGKIGSYANGYVNYGIGSFFKSAKQSFSNLKNKNFEGLLLSNNREYLYDPMGDSNPTRRKYARKQGYELLTPSTVGYLKSNNLLEGYQLKIIDPTASFFDDFGKSDNFLIRQSRSLSLNKLEEAKLSKNFTKTESLNSFMKRRGLKSKDLKGIIAAGEEEFGKGFFIKDVLGAQGIRGNSDEKGVFSQSDLSRLKSLPKGARKDFLIQSAIPNIEEQNPSLRELRITATDGEIISSRFKNGNGAFKKNSIFDDFVNPVAQKIAAQQAKRVLQGIKPEDLKGTSFGLDVLATGNRGLKAVAQLVAQSFGNFSLFKGGGVVELNPTADYRGAVPGYSGSFDRIDNLVQSANILLKNKSYETRAGGYINFPSGRLPRGFDKKAIGVGSYGSVYKGSGRLNNAVFKKFGDGLESIDAKRALVQEFRISKFAEEMGAPVAKVFGSLNRSLKRGGITKEYIGGLSGSELADFTRKSAPNLAKRVREGLAYDFQEYYGLKPIDLSPHNYKVNMSKAEIKAAIDLYGEEGAARYIKRRAKVIDPGLFQTTERIFGLYAGGRISREQLAKLLKSKKFSSITYQKESGETGEYNAAQHHVRRDLLVGASAPAGYKNWTDFDDKTQTLVLFNKKAGEEEAKFRRFKLGGIKQIRAEGNTYDIAARGYINVASGLDPLNQIKKSRSLKGLKDLAEYYGLASPAITSATKIKDAKSLLTSAYNRQQANKVKVQNARFDVLRNLSQFKNLDQNLVLGLSSAGARTLQIPQIIAAQNHADSSFKKHNTSPIGNLRSFVVDKFSANTPERQARAGKLLGTGFGLSFVGGGASSLISNPQGKRATEGVFNAIGTGAAIAGSLGGSPVGLAVGGAVALKGIFDSIVKNLKPSVEDLRQAYLKEKEVRDKGTQGLSQLSEISSQLNNEGLSPKERKTLLLQRNSVISSFSQDELNSIRGDGYKGDFSPDDLESIIAKRQDKEKQLESIQLLKEKFSTSDGSELSTSTAASGFLSTLKDLDISQTTREEISNRENLLKSLENFNAAAGKIGIKSLTGDAPIGSAKSQILGLAKAEGFNTNALEQILKEVDTKKELEDLIGLFRQTVETGNDQLSVLKNLENNDNKNDLLKTSIDNLKTSIDNLFKTDAKKSKTLLRSSDLSLNSANIQNNLVKSLIGIREGTSSSLEEGRLEFLGEASSNSVRELSKLKQTEKQISLDSLFNVADLDAKFATDKNSILANFLQGTQNTSSLVGKRPEEVSRLILKANEEARSGKEVSTLDSLRREYGIAKEKQATDLAKVIELEITRIEDYNEGLQAATKSHTQETQSIKVLANSRIAAAKALTDFNNSKFGYGSLSSKFSPRSFVESGEDFSTVKSGNEAVFGAISNQFNTRRNSLFGASYRNASPAQRAQLVANRNSETFQTNRTIGLGIIDQFKTGFALSDDEITALENKGSLTKEKANSLRAYKQNAQNTLQGIFEQSGRSRLRQELGAATGGFTSRISQYLPSGMGLSSDFSGRLQTAINSRDYAGVQSLLGGLTLNQQGTQARNYALSQIGGIQAKEGVVKEFAEKEAAAAVFGGETPLTNRTYTIYQERALKILEKLTLQQEPGKTPQPTVQKLEVSLNAKGIAVVDPQAFQTHMAQEISKALAEQVLPRINNLENKASANENNIPAPPVKIK